MRPANLRDPAISALFDRISGAAALPGHELVLLQDSVQHEPATLEMLATARHQVLIENYCLDDDDWGRTLIDALVACARRGVQVCIITDWLGGRGQPSRRLKQRLERAGGQWQCWNPLSLTDPLAVFGRNHRKLMVVDGREAMVSGWCHSARWRGKSGSMPWRDTGVRFRGPAAAICWQAFHDSWLHGAPRGSNLLSPLEVDAAGDSDNIDTVTLRLLAGRPGHHTVFRCDQLAIGLAKRRLWLTDAYPAGVPAHLDSLRRAARDGVDVRLLVPGSSDLPVVGMLARSGYRNLLEAGVRIFEWSGPMLHAKTAVMDEDWVRIGSSNLNPASWLGNREMDVLIEDSRVAVGMAERFEADLALSVEIVCDSRHRVRPRNPRARASGKGRLVTAAPLRMTRAMADAVRERRPLDATDATLLGSAGGLFWLLVVLCWWLPWLAVAVISLWGLGSGWILLRLAWDRYREHRRERHKMP